MAGICESLISSNIEPKCDGQAKGFNLTGYIMNKSQILNTTINGNIVSDINLGSSKAFKVVQTRNAFNESTTTMEEGTYRNTLTNEIHFAIIDSSVAAAKQADELNNGEFVLILEQKANNGGDGSKFRVYGFDNGLRCTSLENTPNGDDGNIWNVVLTETGATKAAYYFYKNSESETRAALESLLED